jgi:flagellar biosynthesis protein FlhB
MKYNKKGYVQESVAAIIFLIVGTGVASLVLIFVSVLGGQTYSQTYASINSISDASVKGNITSAIQNSFVALANTGGYLPLIVLAVIIFIILGLVMSLMPSFGMGRGQGYGGSVL